MLLITMLTVAEVVCTVFKGSLKAYKYPVKWLNHYLKGSGKPLEVPDELVYQARSALLGAINKDDYYNRYYSTTTTLTGKYCVSHSTLYEGRGFYGRPSLFYVMGGFTFRLYKKDGRYLVSGNDRYDWHPTEYGDYFTSPLGKSKAMVFIIKVLGLIFGNDLFVTNGWPMGEAGISNKLWDELHKVGAKAFNSYFKNVEIEVSLLDEYCILFNDDIGSYQCYFKKKPYNQEKFRQLKYKFFYSYIDFEKMNFKKFDTIQEEWWCDYRNYMPLEAYIYVNYNEYVLEHERY